MKNYRYSYATENSVGAIEQRDGYRDGWVSTPHGYVIVYSEKGLSSFRFIFSGRMHAMTVNREYTARGLATVAGRFAQSIICPD